MSEDNRSFFLRDTTGETVGLISVQIMSDTVNTDKFMNELHDKFYFYELVERGPLERGESTA